MRERDVHTLGLGLGKYLKCLRHEVVLMQRIADLSALGLDESIAHSAADDQVVNLLEDILDSLDFSLHEVAEHLVFREIFSNQCSRSMSAVSGTECIIDVAVSIGGKCLDESLLALLDSSLRSLLHFV